jgi:transposase
VVAAERDPARRLSWRQEVAALDPQRFVVVDETATTTALTRPYAWAPKNERAPERIPRNYGQTTTLIASLTPEGLGPAMTREGAIDTAAFVAYVREVLGPSLQPGQIVLLDNLSAHKAVAVRDLIAARGCQVLYLPPYSPDFSPIELAFAKLKDFLRQTGARTRQALDEAIRRALDVISPAEARGFFRHCGYNLPADP